MTVWLEFLSLGDSSGDKFIIIDMGWMPPEVTFAIEFGKACSLKPARPVGISKLIHSEVNATSLGLTLIHTNSAELC